MASSYTSTLRKVCPSWVQVTGLCTMPAVATNGTASSRARQYQRIMRITFSSGQESNRYKPAAWRARRRLTIGSWLSMRTPRPRTPTSGMARQA